MIASLRYSSLRTYLECPGKFYEQYILGLESWIPELEYGTMLHAEVEKYHKGEEYSDTIEPYAEWHKATGEPHGRIEAQFLVPLAHPLSGEDLPVPLSGTMDRITDKRIYDFKTSSKSWSQSKADAPLGKPDFWGTDYSGMQATAYCYAHWLETGEILPFSYVIFRKDTRANGKPYPVKTVDTTRTLEDFTRFWHICADAIAEILTRTDWPCACATKEHLIMEPAR